MHATRRWATSGLQTRPRCGCCDAGHQGANTPGKPWMINAPGGAPLAYYKMDSHGTPLTGKSSRRHHRVSMSRDGRKNESEWKLVYMRVAVSGGWGWSTSHLSPSLEPSRSLVQLRFITLLGAINGSMGSNITSRIC